ncbi:MAG: hypothetical protein ACMUIP_06950 [bacterium]
MKRRSDRLQTAKGAAKKKESISCMPKGTKMRSPVCNRSGRGGGSK